MKKTKKVNIKKLQRENDALIAKEYRPISSWGYFGRCILYSIPVIGWIFLLAHAINCKNRNGRSFARSYFCALLVWVIAAAIIVALYMMGFFPNEPQEEPSDTPVTCTHEVTEWVVDKNASCSEVGSKHKECVSCKQNLETAEIATTAHTEEILNGKAASCTESGLTAGKKCSVCNATVLAQTEIPALDHTESSWIIDKAAEIGTDGSKHTECLRCSNTIKTETIPAVDESHVCASREQVTVTPATCKEKGLIHFICSCGKTIKEEPIAMAPHTEETILGTSATCTAGGRTDGKKCTVCGTVTVSQVIIPPTGHAFNNGTCTSCGISEPYGIWIADGLGNPVSDIFVKIMQNGEMVKMYPYKGEFLTMDLEIGTYQIVLDLSGLNGSYTFDESLCTLTPEKRSASIRLFQSNTPKTEVFVGAPISADYPAYYVTEGATKITLTPNDYTFFIFTPVNAAIYTITYEGNADLAVSYHGSSFFVQGMDLSADTESIAKYENGLAVSVYASELGGEYVFAVKSESATSCILKIKNAGDPGTRIQDEPWTPYLEDAAMVEKQLNTTVSGTYTAIDLTDLSLKAVYNEADGYYHLNSTDGPIIFIDLTVETQFIASIQTICGNQRMGTYIYDVNGNLVEKRSYNELFIQYGMPAPGEDPTTDPIRIPLTQKLAEAVQSFGNNNSWWTPLSGGNIFEPVLQGVAYNQEFAWLLYCGYYA